MYYLTLLLGIFSLVPSVSYPAHVVKCANDNIEIKWKENMIQVEFFNITIPDENWDKVCESIIEKEISFEIDPSTALEEPLDIYMFVENELYQSKLVENKLADVDIRNPEFTYYELFFEADIQKPVIGKYIVREVEKKKSQGYVVIVLLFIMWLFMIVYMGTVVRKRKKRS